MENLKCQICPAFYTRTIASMQSHLIRVHSTDQRFNVKCDVPGCQRTFGNARSYQTHLRRNHQEFDMHADVRVWDVIGEQLNEDEIGNMELDNPHDPINNEERNFEDFEDGLVEMKKRNARFLLQTKECNRLTQKASEDIAENVTSLIQDTVELVKIGVQDKLDSVGLNFDDVPGLSGLFETENPLSNPFTHLNTQNKQCNYYKENLGLVVSVLVNFKIICKNIMLLYIFT